MCCRKQSTMTQTRSTPNSLPVLCACVHRPLSWRSLLLKSPSWKMPRRKRTRRQRDGRRGWELTTRDGTRGINNESSMSTRAKSDTAKWHGTGKNEALHQVQRGTWANSKFRVKCIVPRKETLILCYHRWLKQNVLISICAYTGKPVIPFPYFYPYFCSFQVIPSSSTSVLKYHQKHCVSVKIKMWFLSFSGCIALM